METEAEWLTKQQAAERLGLGVRRTLGMAADKTLKTRKVRDPATHQWSVRFHARDIERYLELRRQEAEAQPILEAARTAVEDGLRPSPEAAAALEEIPTKKILEDPTGVDGTYLTRILAITKEIADTQAAGAAIVAALERRMPSAPLSPENPLYLSIERAAACSGLGIEYVRRLIKEGRLPARKIGPRGGWVVRASDIAEIPA